MDRLSYTFIVKCTTMLLMCDNERIECQNSMALWRNQQQTSVNLYDSLVINNEEVKTLVIMKK